jgi:hypothetical protein
VHSVTGPLSGAVASVDDELHAETTPSSNNPKRDLNPRKRIGSQNTRGLADLR